LFGNDKLFVERSQMKVCGCHLLNHSHAHSALRPDLTKHLRSLRLSLAAVETPEIGCPGRGEVKSSDDDTAIWQSIAD
jgi:hypothetical protein